MILIGSRALAIRAPQLLAAMRREPKDFDFICTQNEYNHWKEKNLHKVNPTVLSSKTNSFGMKEIWSFVDNDAPEATPCEFEFVDPERSNILFYNLVVNDPLTIKTSFGLIPSLDLLFTLKATHKHLKDNPHFWKSLFDYHAMKSIGAEVPDFAMDFFKAREKETYAKQKHPSLMRNKENFFKGDGITYVYDHDSIHKAIAVYDRPAYTYFQKDDHEVACDKYKFFSIEEKYRIASVIEESAVLAIERSLVPHPGVLTPEQAWKMAFSKVLTSITSGWWRTWAYDNAMAVLSAWSVGLPGQAEPKTAYHRRFLEGLENGTVVPLDSGLVRPYSEGVGYDARAMAG